MKTAKELDDVLLVKSREAKKTEVAQAEPAYPADVRFTPDAVGALSPASVLQLQRTAGNRAVEQLLAAQPVEQTTEAALPSIQRSLDQEEEDLELPCPGSKIRSGGQGRGKGTGGGKGPLGYPKDEEW
ncbi:MAG: hypothetical protein P8189_29035 [Anaerolineae bacterium]